MHEILKPVDASKKSSDSVGARVIDFINFRFIILSE